MGKIRPGNKQNSFLNQEWAKHVRGYFKKRTARLRRIESQKETNEELKESLEIEEENKLNQSSLYYEDDMN